MVGRSGIEEGKSNTHTESVKSCDDGAQRGLILYPSFKNEIELYDR